MPEQMRVEGVEYTAASDLPTYHPGRCARLTVGDTELGIIAEVHPAVCENYQIGTRAYVAYLDLPTLFAHVAPEKGYRPLPKFPPVSRDLALLCDEELPVAAMEKAIRNAVGGTLETLALFDVYRGAQVAQGKKSVAFSLTMRAADRTLTDEEADAAIQRALQALAALGAQLRS